MIRKFQKLRNANQQVFGQAFIRRLFCSLASERVSDKGREKEGKKEGERERETAVVGNATPVVIISPI